MLVCRRGFWIDVLLLILSSVPRHGIIVCYQQNHFLVLLLTPCTTCLLFVHACTHVLHACTHFYMYITTCLSCCMQVRDRGRDLRAAANGWMRPEIRHNMAGPLSLADKIKRGSDSVREERATVWQRAHSEHTLTHLTYMWHNHIHCIYMCACMHTPSHTHTRTYTHTHSCTRQYSGWVPGVRGQWSHTHWNSFSTTLWGWALKRADSHCWAVEWLSGKGRSSSNDNVSGSRWTTSSPR